MTIDRSKSPISGFAGLVEPISCLVERGDRMSFVRVAALRQHAENARNFVARTITPTGGADGDNMSTVECRQPKTGKAVTFSRNDGLLSSVK